MSYIEAIWWGSVGLLAVIAWASAPLMILYGVGWAVGFF